MNEIQVFKNDELGEIRTITIDGEVYFVGTDVARALGYKDPRTALRNHVEKDDWLKCPVIDNVGRIQQTKVVNESGFYSLVLASKKRLDKKPLVCYNVIVQDQYNTQKGFAMSYYCFIIA